MHLHSHAYIAELLETMAGSDLGPWEILLMGLPTSSTICFLSSFHAWATCLSMGLLKRSLWTNLGPKAFREVRTLGFRLLEESVPWVGLTYATYPPKEEKKPPRAGRTFSFLRLDLVAQYGGSHYR